MPRSLGINLGLCRGAIAPAVTSVTISPSTASLQYPETQQFVVTVNVVGGASQAYTMSLGGEEAGSVNATALYTSAAGAGDTTTDVIATSDFDPTKTATAVVTNRTHFYDSFGGASVALASHTSESSHTWTTPSGAVSTNGTQAVPQTSGAANVGQTTGGAANKPIYFCFTSPNHTHWQAIIYFRYQDANNWTRCEVQRDGGNAYFRLMQREASVNTTLDENLNVAVSGQSLLLKITPSGANITAVLSTADLVTTYDTLTTAASYTTHQAVTTMRLEGYIDGTYQVAPWDLLKVVSDA